VPVPKDWREMMADHARLLEKRTGHGVAEWNERVAARGAVTEPELRAWLGTQGVTGYPQNLLVFEKFGYPDFLTASADELIDAQYADRPQLRPVLAAILLVIGGLDGAVVQARKTKISLTTPKRKFAECAATTRTRVDLFLRIDGEKPSGRLRDAAPREGDVMNLKVALTDPTDVDDEVARALHRAFEANC
jgi:Domain of unknown function (DUF5655)